MIEEIIKKAKGEKKKVYVYAHKFPDGDAISSTGAVIEYLKRQGIDAKYVVIRENRAYGQVVGSVPTTQTVEKGGISLILDTSTVDYAENKLFMSSAKEDMYIIDHHEEAENSIENELGIAKQNVIRNSSASSTCEVLANEFEKEKISPKIADMLTLGLLTDTAKLKFLKPNTLQILAELIKAGANYERVRKSCDRKSYLRDEVGLAKLLLGVQRFQIGDTFATMMLADNRTVRELNTDYGIRNLQKKIFKMSDIENCSFNCMIAENLPGKYDLEFRSNTTYGNFNVFKLAAMHGGGGHYNASGCTLSSKDGFHQENIISTIRQKATDMYAKQGASLATITLTKKDEELAAILENTNRLSEGVTPEVLAQVDELIKQGSNYEYLFKQFKTFERFMLENEILSRVPKDKLFEKAPIVNISLSLEDMKALQQKYEAKESDILEAISIFSTINISAASIELPNGKNVQIDRQGNIRNSTQKEESTR